MVAQESKIRLDLALIKKGFFNSRARAKEAIEQGQIIDDKGNILNKASQLIDKDQNIEFIGENLAYVSRGGLKLEKALDTFSIDVKELVALDIGASTGGFSDVLLQRGAKKIFAVDVGTNQLHDKIKNDSRVIDLSPVNIKDVTAEQLGNLSIDIVVIDVSFISLEKILPYVLNLINNRSIPMVSLIKPQFEAGPKLVGKKGVIKDRKIHQYVLEQVTQNVLELGISTINITDSPILGGSGNKEFLAYFLPEKNATINNNVKLKQITDV